MEVVKWEKYLALQKLGLVSSKEINACIKKYPIDQYRVLLNDLEGVIDEQFLVEKFVILKFIEVGVTYGLFNYKIDSMDDFDGLRRLLDDKYNLLRFTQIWWCKSSKKRKVLCYAGRYSLFKYEDKVADNYGTLEIVIGKSPRTLSYFDGDITIACNVHEFSNGDITKKPVNYSALHTQVIIDLADRLDNAQERISSFFNVCKSLMIKSIALEFKRTEDNLEFIDFDTESDISIISKVNYGKLL